MENIEGVVSNDGSTRPYNPSTDSLMEAMGPEGDTKTIWDPTNEDEVDNAKASFDRLTAKGYRAFLVDKETGEKGELMKEWDPKAGRMIMVPPIQGG